jgi:putative tricarboxylic transport membrane protein
MDFAAIFASLEWVHLLWIVLGLIAGVIVGALPGLNPSTGVAIMLPFTYEMSVSIALLFLCALYCGAVYGGSISAILIGVPGTTSSAVTIWDGHKMQQKGEGGKALGIATIASMLGGVFGSICLIVFTTPLAKVALAFGAPEYFAVSFFGLSVVARLAGDNIAKSFLSMFIGLLIATVGADPFWAVPRFTFGVEELTSGIEFMPVLIGAFAISQVMSIVTEGNYNNQYMTHIPKMRDMLPKWGEFKSWLWTILRSSIIGTFIGVLPGAGATIASFVAYNEGKHFSKHPELYGTGHPEAVAACEAGNNSAAPGALVPLLALGIPGSGTAALLLTAFILHGLRPGPMLFSSQPDLVNNVYGGILIANALIFVVGFLGIAFWARVVNIPNNLLAIMVLILGMMGTYSVNYSMLSVLIMIFSGILGVGMKSLDIPIAPMTLGIVLGFLIEANLRRSLVMSGGNLFIFFQRPISLVLIVRAR